MVCFCDIPPTSLRIHTRKYGPFGLAIDRAHLVRYAARPVMYFPLDLNDWQSPLNHSIIRDIEAVYRALQTQAVPSRGTRQMGSRIMTSEETLNVAKAVIQRDLLAFLKLFNPTLAEDDPQNYYMEREWRRIGNLQFGAEHVKHVIVDDAYVDRARAMFPEYATRIESLEVHMCRGT